MDWSNLVSFGIGALVGVFATLHRSEILAYGGKIRDSLKEYREQMSQPNLEGLETRTVTVNAKSRSRWWQFSGINYLPGRVEERRVTYTWLQYGRNMASTEVLEEIAARRLMLVEDSDTAATVMLHLGDKRAVVLFENHSEPSATTCVIWRDSQEAVNDYSQGGMRPGVKFLVIVSEELVY